MLTELREATTWAVSEASVEEGDRPETLAGAIPLCRPSQAKLVRAALPKGVELVILPLALGIACDVEGLAMSLMLPVWRKDLSTLRVAWQLRGQMVGSIGKVPHIVLRRTIAVGCVVVVAMCLLGAMPAFAIEPGRVDYVGGTAAVALDTIGTLDTTSPTTLVLEYKGPDGTTGQIDIKYEKFAR